jgi:hypothetical protein
MSLWSQHCSKHGSDRTVQRSSVFSIIADSLSWAVFSESSDCRFIQILRNLVGTPQTVALFTHCANLIARMFVRSLAL